MTVARDTLFNTGRMHGRAQHGRKAFRLGGSRADGGAGKTEDEKLLLLLAKDATLLRQKEGAQQGGVAAVGGAAWTRAEAGLPQPEADTGDTCGSLLAVFASTGHQRPRRDPAGVGVRLYIMYSQRAAQASESRLVGAAR